MQGAAEGLAPLLSAQDPNQIARDARYLEYLGRARLSLIEGLRADMRDKSVRANEIVARRQRLRVLEAEQQRERKALEAVHEQRRQALATVSQRLAERAGPIVGVSSSPVGSTAVALERLVVERALSINTAAAGGNASLMTIG